jgi:hypothetical protein
MLRFDIILTMKTRRGSLIDCASRAAALTAAVCLLAAGQSACDKDEGLKASSEMHRDGGNAYDNNLEAALQHASFEAAKSHRNLRGLLEEAAVDVRELGLSAQVPEEGQEEPQTRWDALSRLVHKVRDYARKARAASPALAAADQGAVHLGYAVNPLDREEDLKHDRDMLDRAERRWGKKDLGPVPQRAVDGLADCLAELRSDLQQAQESGGLSTEADAVVRLRERTENAAREAGILRIQLLLCRYDEDRRSPTPAK